MPTDPLFLLIIALLLGALALRALYRNWIGRRTDGGRRTGWRARYEQGRTRTRSRNRQDLDRRT